VLDLAGKGEELAHLRSVARSEMFRTRTVIPEEEIAIDIRIALLCPPEVPEADL
jgi:hypothetical protein